MDTISYKTVDKSNWDRGPWDNEPDKLQWQDHSTGLPCLIIRNRVGALCGYVGVAPGHPLYRKKQAACNEKVDVYDGITFAGKCQRTDDPAHGICHVVADGENDKVWWLGFSATTSNDVHPATVKAVRVLLGDKLFSENPWKPTYKNVQFVKRECRKLARQLNAMA